MHPDMGLKKKPDGAFRFPHRDFHFPDDIFGGYRRGAIDFFTFANYKKRKENLSLPLFHVYAFLCLLIYQRFLALVQVAP